ncbi:hypothetical protein CHS0354_037033 [Potamilus streckersoni]|uniref:Uncharacterized protein n=1 Tax=Potamilus streckersoni TaxID=2493646 RepID=A0AAE0SKQ2_9BIVA|nr:hypothetical protein CHS0354_037033 [Potamilus streckersoni]
MVRSEAVCKEDGNKGKKKYYIDWRLSYEKGLRDYEQKAVWRQVQSLGLANTYAQDDTVRLQVRQLMALGFAPRLLIRTIFQQLRSSAAHVLEPLFEYFEKQWMLVRALNSIIHSGDNEGSSPERQVLHRQGGEGS